VQASFSQIADFTDNLTNIEERNQGNRLLTKEIYDNYIEILKSELIPALGCTEPIAVAYAAAKAKDVLGKFPERAEIWCSRNIIKNVKSVTVPNTGGLKGIDAAAAAGIAGGDPSMGLRVLENMDDRAISKAKELLSRGFCSIHLARGVDNLYISAKVFSGDESAEVCIKKFHTNIFKIVKNGEVLLEKEDGHGGEDTSMGDRSLLNIRDILEFADTVKIADIRPIISNQIKMNTSISDEGLKHDYGVGVGRTLIRCYGNDVKIRARARAAAGSDARMSGCSMPVVINSGSGNQGMAASLPVIEYAGELGVSEEKLYRALVVSNLTAIHQKSAIGRLSAYCGAVSAACGSGAAITYLYGGGYEEISKTIVNTIANVGGIVCDGAKPSCAAKIASAVDAAIMAHCLSTQGKAFQNGEGLVKSDVEGTIASIGRMGSKGMKETDTEILKIMLSR
jgi:L-cysteine desulfidase